MRPRSPSHNFGASYQEGIVTAIDAGKHRVRVKFPHLDNLQSDWLAVRADFAHSHKSYAIPDAGTLVGCILDANGESGIVLGGIYNDKDTPPASDASMWVKHFADGTVISHDNNSGAVSVKTAGQVNVTAGSVAVTADSVTLTAETAVNGNLVVSGTVTAAEVSAGGVTLTKHTHGDSTKGNERTGTP